jgi:hypothetical protein
MHKLIVLNNLDLQQLSCGKSIGEWLASHLNIID